MHNTHEIMNIMHENNVDPVGEGSTERIAFENGRLWPKGVSSEGSESIENSLGTAYIFKKRRLFY